MTEQVFRAEAGGPVIYRRNNGAATQGLKGDATQGLKGDATHLKH